MIKDKKEYLELLQSIEQLSQLAGENPFKVKAYQKALGILENCENITERIQNQTLTELPGIGKGINEILTEFSKTGQSTLQKELQTKIPKGLIEFSKIQGLGPKKAMALIEELQIHTLGELEYACKENRLLGIKGFGQKIQDQILKSILFLKNTENFIRIDRALELSNILQIEIKKLIPEVKISEAGLLRRRLETMDKLEFVIGSEDSKVKEKIKKFQAQFIQTYNSPPLEITFCKKENFESTLFFNTGTEEHLNALGIKKNIPQELQNRSEVEIYEKFKLPFIPPEMREGSEILTIAKEKKIHDVFNFSKVRGVFHNHTTYSDGKASCEEMIQKAISLGYEYLGISDHSQSAFYAQGLKKETLKKQEKEIRDLQDKYPEIRIFWGVESDILADGSLDYDTATLKKFDFVVASIHSRFQMDQETMTQRILAAIRNPYTTFWGHPTGRLLLGRAGYEVDLQRILLAAKESNVAIEINANPYRLDLDWRHGSLLRKNKNLVSIHPDAHDTDGLEDTSYGITVARKALLPEKQILNSLGPKEIEKWLKDRN